MDISKVYYEELRSICIDGKWTSKKIGAEVDIGRASKSLTGASMGLDCAKKFVRTKLDAEIEVEDNKKYKEAFEKIQKKVQYEADKIEEEDACPL